MNICSKYISGNKRHKARQNTVSSYGFVGNDAFPRAFTFEEVFPCVLHKDMSFQIHFGLVFYVYLKRVQSWMSFSSVNFL